MRHSILFFFLLLLTTGYATAQTCHLCDPIAYLECVAPSDGALPGIWIADECTCRYNTPIIIDLGETGLKLTDPTDGVLFDINADGQLERTSWTASASEDAFLVLDRNGNHEIDDARELFGNKTLQPGTLTPNGFNALSALDSVENGGNSDGVIDARDRDYALLRLWVDSNHDGRATREEIFTLPEKSVFSISLDYRLSRRRDSEGNVFRYRASVNEGIPGHLPRWAVDVVLNVIQSADNHLASNGGVQ